MTVVVVTGASSGVGASAARLFHRMGASLVLVGRDAARTAAIADELDATGYVADFACLNNMRDLADRVRRTHAHIEVLAANAGGVPPEGRTVDGIEATFQVNALAPWLLMTLLAGPLAGGRVVATSSRSHTGAAIEPQDVDRLALATDRLSRHRAYARAKLAAGILLREFGRRHPDIDVGDFHPRRHGHRFRPLSRTDWHRLEDSEQTVPGQRRRWRTTVDAAGQCT